MLRPTYLAISLPFITLASPLSATYMVSSKEEALNKFKARQQTYNVSYPGGDTTTTQTSTCPPQTTCPATTCPECDNKLVYILTPILTVVGFGAGSIVGALCMKRFGVAP